MLSVKERLTKMIAGGCIPHSLLFFGPKKGEKEKIALEFAADAIGDPRILKGFHPDVHLYLPEGKTGMHTLQSLRTLADDVALAPFEAPLQFFIIHEAERMLPTGANALLKTFEEPTPHSIIILLTSHPERILPTIYSRCQSLYIHAEPVFEKAPYLDLFLDILSGEKNSEELKQVVALIENENVEQGSQALLAGVMMWYRDLYALKVGAEEHLFFPEKKPALENMQLLPIRKVETIVKQAQLAMQRSVKLSVCLEALLIQLSGVSIKTH